MKRPPKRNPETGSFAKKKVLLAVTGMSPAVLTETVWALATKADPVLVDEVYVMTTEEGKKVLTEQLFGGDCGWDRMVAALSKRFGSRKAEGKFRFGTSDDCIRVLASPDGRRNLSDVASSEDNAQVADYFLKTIREFTEDPSVDLYASIAGGRKTMSALMLSCMTLVGRAEDHVLHVLVNSPFDRPLEPPFLFPEKGLEHREVRAASTGKAARYASSAAKISLIDIPFVKMRGWYQDKFSEQPAGYGMLVRAAQETGPQATTRRPNLTFDYNFPNKWGYIKFA